jgi:hypothetical protein
MNKIFEIVLLIFLLSGCASVIGKSKDEIKLNNTEIISSTNTSTYTKIPSFTLTIDPIPTATKTLLPTLDEAASKDKLLKLSDFHGCEKPCWWDIKLGKTKFSELQILLQQLNIQYETNHYNEDPNRKIYFIQDQGIYEKLETDISFTTTEDVIQIIQINSKFPGNSENIKNYESFRKTWKFLNLPTLFSAYGDPDRIYLDKDFEGANLFYRLWIFYEKQGFAIEYLSGSDDVLPRVCLDIYNSHIRFPSVGIYLKSNEIPDSLERISNGHYLDGMETLETATSLTNSEFISLVTNTKWDGCINTNWHKEISGPF